MAMRHHSNHGGGSSAASALAPPLGADGHLAFYLKNARASQRSTYAR